MKVLFVCTGNICRSPMGELMFPPVFSRRFDYHGQRRRPRPHQ
ncbi:hypothetical protein [Bifidobacterium pseudolongum]|nr:hypothetical protein [Bifidobacterium pseudolongum]